MHTVGIIAEYNPFHHGHRHQLDQIRRRLDTPTIVVAMSGSFTQRGEPAILDKFLRAHLAVHNGVDLVVELPFSFATRSAQDFARGGLSILSSLGIDHLAFGSEIDDLPSIKRAAKLVDSTELRSMLRTNLAAGQSYARALREALSSKLNVSTNDAAILQPNSLLAIEYVRALRGTSIEPLLIPRLGSAHDAQSIADSNVGSIASASAIRAELPDCSSIGSVVDTRTLEVLRTIELPSMEKLFLPSIVKILNSTAEELRSIVGMGEGLEYKLIRAARSTSSYDALLGSMVSRRYTRSRLQRLMLHVLLGLTSDEVARFDGVQYVRVLAFNERGRTILRAIKNSVPVVTKLARHLTTRAMYGRLSTLETYQQMLALDVRATELRELLCRTPRLGLDFLFRWKE